MRRQAESRNPMDYQAARTNMVESQVRTNKVTDQGIIDALLRVPRELFVPPPLRGIAYVDEDLDLGSGRHLMEPMVLARLLQAAALRAGHRVLVVGCGSGYPVALVAALAGEGVGARSRPPPPRRARALFPAPEISNPQSV